MKLFGNIKISVGALCAITATLLATADKPNVVIFFIDDMGYGDIEPFGSKLNKTPELNRMAAEGLKFTNFYVASTQCSPSRAALLTGCYAERVGMDGKVCFPNVDKALNPEEYTLAEMLKDAGYATGCFGKWHLGHRSGYLPNDHGFDTYQGIPYSNDMWRVWNAATGQWKSATEKQDFPPLPWLVDGKPVAVIKDGVDQSWLTQATTRAGLDFIRQQAAKPSSSRQPFFCYLPYAAVHLPRFGHPDFLPDDYSGEGGKDIADYDIGIHLKAQIEELDWAVGQVLNTLNELGIEKNTLVLFLSDNGGSRGTDMGPLRGSKYSSVYEGGQRTAFLAWWPGTIPAGRTSDEIGISSDLLPTLAGLCGGFLSDRPIDGKDIANLFIESENAQSPHESVPNKGRGYRQGKWKIVGGSELFDLESDPGETENLAKQYPEKQKELIAENKAWVSSMQNEARPHAKMPDPSPIITDNEADDLPKLLDWLGERKDAR